MIRPEGDQRTGVFTSGVVEGRPTYVASRPPLRGTREVYVWQEVNDGWSFAEHFVGDPEVDIIDDRTWPLRNVTACWPFTQKINKTRMLNFAREAFLSTHQSPEWHTE